MSEKSIEQQLQEAKDDLRRCECNCSEMEQQLQEAEDDLRRCECNCSEMEDALDDAQSEIDRLTDNFSYASQALRANRIEDALHELEKALPDEFIGFAETIIKWSKRHERVS